MSMEEKGNHHGNLGSPSFCRNGCGFYAAQAFDGMCSKCYKDVKQLQQELTQAATGTTAGTPQAVVDDVDSMAAALSRTSLGDMNVNTSSNNNSQPNSPASSSSESLATTANSAVVTATTKAAAELATASPTVPTMSPTVATSSQVDSGAAASEESSFVSVDGEGSTDGDKGKKPKKNRCMECRKKVGLTGFVCHCGKLFCSLHRYSDTHDCTFDFKEKGQEEIRRNNPVIKGEKIQKI